MVIRCVGNHRWYRNNTKKVGLSCFYYLKFDQNNCVYIQNTIQSVNWSHLFQIFIDDSLNSLHVLVIGLALESDVEGCLLESVHFELVKVGIGFYLSWHFWGVHGVIVLATCLVDNGQFWTNCWVDEFVNTILGSCCFDLVEISQILGRRVEVDSDESNMTKFFNALEFENPWVLSGWEEGTNIDKSVWKLNIFEQIPFSLPVSWLVCEIEFQISGVSVGIRLVEGWVVSAVQTSKVVKWERVVAWVIHHFVRSLAPTNLLRLGVVMIGNLIVVAKEGSDVEVGLNFFWLDVDWNWALLRELGNNATDKASYSKDKSSHFCKIVF